MRTVMWANNPPTGDINKENEIGTCKSHCTALLFVKLLTKGREWREANA